MKAKIFSLLGIVAMLLSMVGAPTFSRSASVVQNMPANPDKILELLIREGKVKADAPVEVQEAAVLAYLQQKMGGKGEDSGYNPRARKEVDNYEATASESANILRGRKLGNKTVPPNSSPTWMDPVSSSKLLLILVEFSDTPYTWTPTGYDERTEAGPLHNQIPVPDNSFDLYVPDFSADHFQKMMFTPGGWEFPANSPRYAGEKRGSMLDYFLQQSFGQFLIEGETFGWYEVDKPEAFYGDDNPDGGHDNLAPGNTKTLLHDAVGEIGASIPWEDYATPYADGYCILDHPLFIHAGIDQSGGGGAQGDDSIWAHSSSTWEMVAPASAACPEGTWLYNYIIMPEDGGVGVFAHEFTHDLGLPDEYDTVYSGRGDSNAFWTLQSSGSWLGVPAQTQPSGMSAWAKYAIGWMNPGVNLAVTNLATLAIGPQDFVLEQAERWAGTGTLNGLRISLPPKAFFVNAPYSGVYEWFGGKADEIDTNLVRTVDLTGKTSASLSFATWYDIEEQWDFGFVQVSTDGGATWTSLPIDGTRSDIVAEGYPSMFANMPGFTGNSGGWVLKTHDISAYAGQVIQLQFRYMTDWGTSLAGFYVDDIGVTADGSPVFFDDVETLDAAWTADGWTRDMGSGTKTHYYIMEYRNLNAFSTVYDKVGDPVNIVNFDNGLKNTYSFDPYTTGNPNEPERFSYAPGLLLFYRDMTFTDNWTGAHPGGGFMLVVDAHPNAIMRPPYTYFAQTHQGGYNVILPWNTRIQSYDATFDTVKAPSMWLSYWNKLRHYVGLNAVPNFNDSMSYWNKKAPAASVITPTYGVLFNITGVAQDSSAAAISVGLKGATNTTGLSELFEEFEDLLGLIYTYLPYTSH